MIINVNLPLHVSSTHSLNSSHPGSHSYACFKFPTSKSSGSCEFSSIPTEISSFNSNSFEIYKNVIKNPIILVDENQITIEMYLPNLRFDKTVIVLKNKNFRLHVEIEKPAVNEKTNQKLTYKFSQFIKLPELVDESKGFEKKYENVFLKISFQTRKLIDLNSSRALSKMIKPVEITNQYALDFLENKKIKTG